jgi:hypothetical protein
MLRPNCSSHRCASTILIYRIYPYLSHLSVRPSDRHQLNMYLTPSCIRQTSSVLTFFWNE